MIELDGAAGEGGTTIGILPDADPASLRVASAPDVYKFAGLPPAGDGGAAKWTCFLLGTQPRGRGDEVDL